MIYTISVSVQAILWKAKLKAKMAQNIKCV